MQLADGATSRATDPKMAALIKAVNQDVRWWINNLYTVAERRQETENGTLVHLSIHNHNRTAHHDWRHLQRIKNDILGPEEEAVEVFPAESRLVDTSNEFHLWAILGARLPFGYQERLVSDGGYDLGAKQRLWEEGDRPADCRQISKEEVMAYFTEKENETKSIPEQDDSR